MAVVFRAVRSGHLQVEFGLHGWTFVFCQDGRTWRGHLAKRDVETNASELGQALEEYTEVARCLFSNGGSSEDFEIEAKTSESGCVELSWKKLTSTDVKYSLGCVAMVESDSSEVDKILKNAFAAISKLKQELKDQNLSNTKLKSDNERLSEQLVDFASKKADLEGQLFTKFARILNEKKAKIRALNKENRSLQNYKTTVNEEQNEDSSEEIHSTPPRASPEPRKRQSPCVKISLEDSLNDTEDFISKIPKRESRKKKFVAEYPSTSGRQQVHQYQKLGKNNHDDMDTSFIKNDSPELDETVDASEMLNDL